MYRPYQDLDGLPIKRNPIQYPYSYDLFVTYKVGTRDDITGSVYSDRLYQWDSQKYNDLCEKHFGNRGKYFDTRNPGDIEKFLSEYLGKSLDLIAIMQGCNVSTGFPVWWFGYREARS